MEFILSIRTLGHYPLLHYQNIYYSYIIQSAFIHFLQSNTKSDNDLFKKLPRKNISRPHQNNIQVNPAELKGKVHRLKSKNAGMKT